MVQIIVPSPFCIARLQKYARSVMSSTFHGTVSLMRKIVSKQRKKRVVRQRALHSNLNPPGDGTDHCAILLFVE